MLSSPKKAKLIWNSRRGMLELDLMLQRFVACHLDLLTDSQIESYEQLLTAQDPDLYSWLMGYQEPQSPELKDIVALIQHVDPTRKIN